MKYIRNINLNFVKNLGNKGFDPTGDYKEAAPKVTDLLSKQAAKLQKLKNLQERFQVCCLFYSKNCNHHRDLRHTDQIEFFLFLSIMEMFKRTISSIFT